jgi:hypothetical protein
MSFEIENLPEAIRQVKKDLRRALPNYAEVFRDVESEMRNSSGSRASARADIGMTSLQRRIRVAKPSWVAVMRERRRRRAEAEGRPKGYVMVSLWIAVAEAEL